MAKYCILFYLITQYAMTKEYQLDLLLRDKSTGNEAFSESYQIAMSPEFVEKFTPKEHCFKLHAENFVVQLKKNNMPLVKKPFKKWEIYVVSYGMGIWSIVNWDRPSIVYKNSDYTLGEDITVIPLTSAVQQKHPDKFDVLVPKDDSNQLYQSSFARVRQLKAQSLKNIGKYVGTITDEDVMQAIDKAAKEMLGILQ